MVVIKKGRPPKGLVAFRRRKGASYDSVDFPRKEVYEALLREQGGLCAYCMSRITAETIHIEHWIPQKGEFYAGEYSQEDCSRLAIDYQNMLGVCPGGKGMPYVKTTCDHHRQNERIVIDPRQQWMVESIQYGRDGIIRSTDEQIHHDISVTLNLNEETLTANRKSVWSACKKAMERQRGAGTWTRAMIDKQIAHYERRDENGNFSPYAGMVLYWLRKFRQKAP